MNVEEYNKIRNFLVSGELPSDLESSHAKFGFKRKCRPYAVDQDEETLYYTQKHKDGSIRRRAKVVVGTTEDAKAAFQEVHNAKTYSHPGLNRSMQQISQKYFWPRMTYDVIEWIKECPVCLRGKDSEKTRLVQLKVSEPWEILMMSVIGPVNDTAEGYKYIFMAVDFYSKWVEAFPICNKFPGEVAACLKVLFYRHGACKSVLTDETSPFVEEINSELDKQLGVQHHTKPLYHPKISTLDDKYMDEIKSAFLNLATEHAYDWPHRIDQLLFMLRTKKHAVTKFTPFYLFYKREVRLPPIPGTDPITNINADFNLEQILQPNYETTATIDRPTEIRTHQKLIDSSKVAQVEQLIENAKSLPGSGEYQFTVGEKVLISNGRKRPIDITNPDTSFTGPYTVVDAKSSKVRVVSLKDLTQVKTMTNLERLIPFKETYKLSMYEPRCISPTITVPLVATQSVAVEASQSLVPVTLDPSPAVSLENAQLVPIDRVECDNSIPVARSETVL